MKKWIAILLVAIMALSVVACSDKNKGKKQIVGTWTVDTETTLAGLNAAQQAEYRQTLNAGYSCTFVFNKDGSGVVYVSGNGMSNTADFKYTISSNTLTMASEYGTEQYTYSFKGDKLYLTNAGVTQVFKRN